MLPENIVVPDHYVPAGAFFFVSFWHFEGPVLKVARLCQVAPGARTSCVATEAVDNAGLDGVEADSVAVALAAVVPLHMPATRYFWYFSFISRSTRL